LAINIDATFGFHGMGPTQRVCMRVAGGKEDGVNEDFAGQSSANFLSSAA
jgi:hypothetical protein